MKALYVKSFMSMLLSFRSCKHKFQNTSKIIGLAQMRQRCFPVTPDRCFLVSFSKFLITERPLDDLPNRAKKTVTVCDRSDIFKIQLIKKFESDCD